MGYCIRDALDRRRSAQVLCSLLMAAAVGACGGGSGSSSAPVQQPVVVTVSPPTPSVQAGIGTQQFTASVSNTTNTAVTWQVNSVPGGNATVGMISSAGLYTAPASVPSPATVVVTAVSAADASKSGTAQVTITPPVSVAVAPLTANVVVGTGSKQFAATVSNTSDATVTWKVNGVAGGNATFGTISATGLYTAPASIPSPATVTVTAVSVADPARSGAASVTVVSAASIAVTVAPRQAALTTLVPQTFVATVTGSANTAVTWTVDTIPNGNPTVGTISASGVYAPPSSAGEHTLTATSKADSSKSASATVTVTDLTGVTTQRYDAQRTGQNLKEYALTPTLLATSGAFGKLFSCKVDGEMYAQPLYVANLSINGGVHNVVFVATQHDSIYAFDADASPCTTYWHTSLLPSGATPIPAADTGEASDVLNEFGVTGTPVISLANGALYAAAATKESGSTYVYRLHALDLATGAEKVSSPVQLSGTVGAATFSALPQMQRPGLLLVNNIVYIAFGSHGDNPTYYGWLFGYDGTSLAQVTLFNTAPSAQQGALWMTGAGPAADSSGNIYVSTANGTFDASNTTAPNNDFGDTVLKLSTTSGLTVTDFFTPNNQDTLRVDDWDLGSGGVLVLPDAVGSTAHPHLLVTGDKEAKLFLIDRDAMGKYTAPPGPDQSVQTLAVGSGGACITCGFFSTPSVWGNRLYTGVIGDTLKVFSISNAAIATTPASRSAETYLYPGTNPVISAAGASGGVAWALDTHATAATGGSGAGPAVLRAYDATDLSKRLWSSDASSADTCGNAVKFAVPKVANGKVYVGGASQLTVYGLLP
jgi:hypothetical protein